MSRTSGTGRQRVAKVVVRIDSLPGDPRVARIFVSGQRASAAQVPRESLTELRLSEGCAWNATLSRRVALFVRTREARDVAMRALARASHNTTTMTRLLQRRGFDGKLVVAMVEQLRSDGWLNDDEHARRRAESTARRHPGISAQAMAGVLEDQGIDEARSRREARSVADSPEHRQQALAMARTAIRRRGRRSAIAVAAALARRGMDESILEDALRLEGIDLET